MPGGPVTGAVAAVPGGAARTVNAWLAVRPSSRSVTTSTPSSAPAGASGSGPRARRIVMPSSPTFTSWAAACSTTPHWAGKNHTSAIRSGASPRAAIERTMLSGVAEKDAGHGLGTGTARRACAISAAPRGSGGGLSPTTGKVSATRASSGMQIFSHTSHDAWPRRVTRDPGSRPPGTEIRVRRTTSPE